MDIFNRNLYYKKISPFIGTNLIKVITGQRRVGKSYFMQSVMYELGKISSPEDIIYINKEDFEFDFIKDYSDLIQYVEKLKVSDKKTALFIDEIQDITNFEKALGHFFTTKRYDIYCTGSNANLLSGELATLLSGRTIEIEIFSLNYSELLEFHKLNDTDDSLQSYIRYGGMPMLIHFGLKEEIVYEYLKNLYNTILVKDVIARHAIRNVNFLRNLTFYIADNTGSIITAKSINDYLKSQQINMSSVLVQEYLKHLSNAFFIHQVKRSDIQGKRIFEIGEKYYFNDSGLRNALVGYKISDISKILEKIEFTHIKEETKAAAGNISIKIKKLHEAGYINVEKTFKNNYPNTMLSITEKGAKAFESYVSTLRKYINPK